MTAPGSDGVGTGCDTSNTNAAGYFKYYAGAAKVGTSGEGWYSYDIGSWHLVAINSNCPNKSCGTSGAQYQWLANDLATHKNQCIAAYWHIPLWSSGGRAAPNTQQIVNQLYSAHADVILNGHDHIYERFAPQNSSGGSDPTRGIVEFIAGTGGANHTSLATTAANSVYRDDKNFGVLKLTLHPASYDYAFVNTAGTVLDSNGSTPVACHNTGSSGTVPPAPTVTASGSDATDYGTGTTAYYRQGTAGSFTVAATSAGATSMTFPSISGLTGGGADTSAPFSATYTRTASTTPSGSFGVTASNTAGTSPSTSFTVTPDATSPLTTASCIPSNCAAASGSQVSVTLTSTDTGSGVAAIYYTTNGTAPTTSSPSVSSGTAVNVPAGQTIQFFGVDRVGNQESIKSKATTVSARWFWADCLTAAEDGQRELLAFTDRSVDRLYFGRHARSHRRNCCGQHRPPCFGNRLERWLGGRRGRSGSSAAQTRGSKCGTASPPPPSRAPQPASPPERPSRSR